MKILVVDDDPASLSLLAEQLHLLNAEVLAIGDSATAARIVQQHKFDGAFLDLAMPVLSGYDLAKLIRESSLNGTIPIVIVTGSDEPNVMNKSFSLGATYFLHKPINQQELSEVLNDFRAPRYDNRRRFARVPLYAAVTCTFGLRTMYGTIWNISQGGVQLEVEGLQNGDNIRLSFLLDNLVIKAQGMIVWVNEDRKGLIFTEMSITHQEAIRIFVARAGS